MRRSGRRERIVSGFDSESEGEVVKAEVREMEEDELDGGDEGERGKEGNDGSDGKKRDIGQDDDVSGEVIHPLLEFADDQLLELASEPSKKRQQKAPQQTPATASQRQHQPTPHRSQHGLRSSLPASFPQVPTTQSLTFTLHTQIDPYSVPLQTLISSLPSVETQTILFNTVSTDPFLMEGVSLLQPQYQEDFRCLLERWHGPLREGDATTIANAFALLALALRILPKETSDLLLASTTSTYASLERVGSPQTRSLARIISLLPPISSDPTPLDQRYFDLALLAAQIAEQSDAPSVMLVMFKLMMYRCCMVRRDRTVLASGWLAQAVKIAQALGMGKEWEGIPQGERELRRRMMWSLYIADRQHSFETSFPYTILDAHQGIHLPSPCSEADLYNLRGDPAHLPPHSTETGPTACTAMFIHTHLARRITPILGSFATATPANTPQELLLRFDASLDAFQDALPAYLRLFPLTDTRYDSTHPYLAPHRVRLHATLLSYRSGAHRAHLAKYLLPSTPAKIRPVIAQVCLSSLRIQRSAKMLDAKIAPRLFNPVTIFESAATLALIMHVEKAASKLISSEHVALRAGVADGIELLENVLILSENAYATKAVRILRAILNKVEATSAAHGDPHSSDDPSSKEREVSPEHLPTPPTTSDANFNDITAWLEDLRKNGVSMEYILRDPEWIGGWDRVVTGM